ncbi:hypothetical protein BDV98DRAFT_534496 [Pterulicium gracile]|uniref:Uncharacterized protein n=1 Tax=Pterulicium gracile TaxID=1884261 RepID=A0A5C3QCB0_9AGAR|nr:hypothetical protein BDV98DRAFT_534496 [Pterula gracilis]
MPGLVPKLLLLVPTIGLGVTGLAFGITALHNLREDEKKINSLVPEAVNVTIDANDVLKSGISVAVACGIAALTALIALIYSFIRGRRSSQAVVDEKGHGRKSKAGRLFGLFLLFIAVWLFASLVPLTLFVATRKADVIAMLGETRLPDSLVHGAQSSYGLTPIYKELSWMVRLVVVPWIELVFVMLSGIYLLIAA